MNSTHDESSKSVSVGVSFVAIPLGIEHRRVFVLSLNLEFN